MAHGKLPPSFTAKPGVHRATTPETGGPLLVTPAGTTAVATDALHAHLDRLETLGNDLAREGRALLALRAETPWSAAPGAPAAARRSGAEVDAAPRAGERTTLYSELTDESGEPRGQLHGAAFAVSEPGLPAPSAS